MTFTFLQCTEPSARTHSEGYSTWSVHLVCLSVHQISIFWGSLDRIQYSAILTFARGAHTWHLMIMAPDQLHLYI